MSLKIRPVEENNAETCGKIGYEAHKSISSSHGYPSEQPSKEYAIGLIKTILSNPNSLGVLAERQGTILGSIFLHKFPSSPVAVIGPLRVHPSTERGIGRVLMDAVIVQLTNRTTIKLDWCNHQVIFAPLFYILKQVLPFKSHYF